MNYVEIRSKLNEELKKSIKEKNEAIKSVVSILSSKLAAINKEAGLKGKEVTEQDIIAILSSELKQTKESLEGAIKSGREEAIAKANDQIKFIESFLPKQMTEEEIIEFVKNKITSLGIENPTNKDFGLIMKNVSPELKGKADGKLVSQIVKSLL